MSQQVVPIAINSENFSVAFKQMCNFVAISDSTNTAATVEKLIQQCFVLRPSDKFASADDFIHIISQRFGVDLPERSIKNGLDRLQKAKVISFAGSRYQFSESQKTEIQNSIEEANALEERVKVGWWEVLASGFKYIDLDIGDCKVVLGCIHRRCYYAVELVHRRIKALRPS